MTVSNESGRTMLEMLGVLGIMGIIMYGAVSGINYGMSTYKINQIYNDVQEQIDAVTTLYSWSKSYTGNLTQVACDNDVFSRGCADGPSGKFGLHPYGEGILIKQKDGGNSFELEYQNIPADACARLKEMEWGMIKITPPDKCTADSTMTWEPQ